MNDWSKVLHLNIVIMNLLENSEIIIIIITKKELYFYIAVLWKAIDYLEHLWFVSQGFNRGFKIFCRDLNF